MIKTLGLRPNLDHLKKEAKRLHRSYIAKEEEAIGRVRRISQFWGDTPATDFRLRHAQVIVARQYGFSTWRRLKEEVERLRLQSRNDPDSLLYLACQGPRFGALPGDEAHTAARAEKLLASHPEFGQANFYLACAAADFDIVAREINKDAQLASRLGGPKQWPPLLYLCFSTLVNSSPIRSANALRIGTLLLKHRANPNVSWTMRWEGAETRLTALFGAIGCANHPGLTELLLKAGADPTDAEAMHRATGYSGHEHFKLLLEKGAKVPDQIGLLRKLLYNDLEGLRLLVEHGVEINELGPRGTALHAAIRQGHGRDFCELLAEHGADLRARNRSGLSPFQLASRFGNISAAAFLKEKGADDVLNDREAFLAACMAADEKKVTAILARQPNLLDSFAKLDWGLLEHAAGLGRVEAVRIMVKAGFPLDWGVVRAAVVGGRVETVKMLIDAGTPLEFNDPDFPVSLIDSAIYGLGMSSERQISAREDDYAEIIRMLLKAGVKPMEKIPDTLPEALSSLLLGGRRSS